MDGLLLALLLGVLVGALVFTSRRWGPSQLYTPVTVALWATATIFAALLLLSLWRG